MRLRFRLILLRPETARLQERAVRGKPQTLDFESSENNQRHPIPAWRIMA
jgi:hypothetical protein